MYLCSQVTQTTPSGGKKNNNDFLLLPSAPRTHNKNRTAGSYHVQQAATLEDDVAKHSGQWPMELVAKSKSLEGAPALTSSALRFRACSSLHACHLAGIWNNAQRHFLAFSFFLFFLFSKDSVTKQKIVSELRCLKTPKKKKKKRTFVFAYMSVNVHILAQGLGGRGGWGGLSTAYAWTVQFSGAYLSTDSEEFEERKEEYMKPERTWAADS